jgi:quercetin dioxygenase-like cupin family protein
MAETFRWRFASATKRTFLRAASYLLLPGGMGVTLYIAFFDQGAFAQHAILVSCRPVSEKKGPEGCWILASEPMGQLTDKPVYWTLDTYRTEEAAQRHKTESGTVVQALDKVWVLSVGPKLDDPVEGHRTAQIGPMPIRPGEAYTAQYMEAILPAGAVSRTHVHSGPEAFYTESGESCLETPEGKRVGRNGKDIIIPEGEPMELVASGDQVRRGLVLVLHSSSKPATTVVDTWKSKGLCTRVD